MKNKIRTRLVLWTVLLEAGILIVFGSVLVFFVYQLQTKEISDSLHLSAAELNAVIDVSNNKYFSSDLKPNNFYIRNVMAWIIAPDGHIGMTVGDADKYAIPSPLPANDTISTGTLDNNEKVKLLTSFLQEGDQWLGTIVLASPLSKNDHILEQIILGLILIIPAGLILSAIGGWFLAAKAMAPVAKITSTARDISARDLSRRLNFNMPDDEIGHLADTIDEMLERLDLAFQRERQFTADVSHELRTPLGFLKTQLSLARSRDRDAQTLLKMMKDMETDVDRLSQLVEQMLNLARVESDKASAFEKISIDKILSTVVNKLKLIADNKGILYSLQLSIKKDCIVSGNNTQLGQVFFNIIENALKYTPSGEKVTVKLEAIEDKVIITVADMGPGIEPEHIPHIFERFYRVDSSRIRKSGGFGLGLALSKAIVKAHKGDIFVKSNSGKGSVFTVILPIINNG